MKEGEHVLTVNLSSFKDYVVSVYKLCKSVIPAGAGIQNLLKQLDSGFHWNDENGTL